MPNSNANGKIKVERGIELFGPRGVKNTKYPWDELQIGDSFEFPADIKCNTAYNVARLAGYRRNAKYSIRRQENGRLRCWRVA